LVEKAKLTRPQNRLGFIVSLAAELAKQEHQRACIEAPTPIGDTRDLPAVQGGHALSWLNDRSWEGLGTKASFARRGSLEPAHGHESRTTLHRV